MMRDLDLTFVLVRRKVMIGRYRLRVMMETFDAAQLATAKSGTGIFFSELVNGGPRKWLAMEPVRVWTPGYLLLGT